MSWQDNPITRNFGGTSYIVTESASSFPYAVVPKTTDPLNKYDFDEVAAFWAALPAGDSKKLQAGDIPLPPGPTEEEVLAAYERQVASYLTEFVKERGYQDVADCVTYLHSPTGQKVVEAQYILLAREVVWADWATLKNAVETGAEELPVSWADAREFLPVLVWPKDYAPADGDLLAQDLADRLISTDADNNITAGSDRLLFVSRTAGE